MAEERPAKMRKLSHVEGDDESGSDVKSNATDSPDIVVDSNTPQMVDSKPTDDQTAEGPAHSNNQDGEPKPMSKNQLKKLRKREEWEAGREYRKVKRKQKAKEKKERKRAAWEERKANGDVEAQPTSRKPRNPVRLPITFIIDCGFDDLMMEKEMISLGSQLTRSYSDNSRAIYQAHLVVSSWSGKLKERFDTVLNGHYKKWKGMKFLEEDFVEVAEKAKGWMADPKTNRVGGVFAKYANQPERQDKDSQLSKENAQPLAEADLPQDLPDSKTDNAVAPGNGEPLSTDQLVSAQKEDNNLDVGESSDKSVAKEGEIIYLSSDSPYILEELKPNSTYIIGGLVDKNRHKGICHKIATEKGLRTAKLPISDFMEMTSRSVLATNHVNEIMLRWLDCGDWGKAFMQVIPKRKGGKLREQDEDAEDADEASTPGDENDDGLPLEYLFTAKAATCLSSGGINSSLTETFESLDLSLTTDLIRNWSVLDTTLSPTFRANPLADIQKPTANLTPVPNARQEKHRNPDTLPDKRPEDMATNPQAPNAALMQLSATLFLLPPEVRNMIYRYLDLEVDINVAATSSTAIPRYDRIYSGDLVTLASFNNHFLRQEILNLRHTCDVVARTGPGTDMRALINSISTAQFHNIVDLRMQLFMGYGQSPLDVIRYAPASFGSHLPKLRRLTFALMYSHLPIRRYTPEMDAICGQITAYHPVLTNFSRSFVLATSTGNFVVT